MEGKLTLKDKVEKIEGLSREKYKVETLLRSCKHRNLELKVNDYTSFYFAKEEKLNELIQEYFELELEKINEELNNLIK